MTVKSLGFQLNDENQSKKFLRGQNSLKLVAAVRQYCLDPALEGSRSGSFCGWEELKSLRDAEMPITAC